MGGGANKRTTSSTIGSGFAAVDARPAEKHSQSCQHGRRLMAITAFDAGNKHLSRRVTQAVGNNRFPESKIRTGYRTRPQWGVGPGNCSSLRFF
jgi:hypothetical protein